MGKEIINCRTRNSIWKWSMNHLTHVGTYNNAYNFITVDTRLIVLTQLYMHMHTDTSIQKWSSQCTTKSRFTKITTMNMRMILSSLTFAISMSMFLVQGIHECMFLFVSWTVCNSINSSLSFSLAHWSLSITLWFICPYAFIQEWDNILAICLRFLIAIVLSIPLYTYYLTNMW